jgi:hypothetical protein
MGIPPLRADMERNMTNAITATQPTTEQLIAMIKQLEEKNAALVAQAAQPAKKITLKVSEKGGLSLYGLGRFPVTLYRSQWERLTTPDTIKQITDFIAANSALLTVKA